MGIYIGFYAPTRELRDNNMGRARDGQGPDPAFLEMVQGLPEQLPEGCHIIGSYGTTSTDRPNVMILESPDNAGPAFVTRYYMGYLDYDWVPAVQIGASTAERTQWAQQVSEPRPR